MFLFQVVDHNPGAYSIDSKLTASLRLVWVGVQPIEQTNMKQTANFHGKQWKLIFDGFGWVQTQPEICGAIEYAYTRPPSPGQTLLQRSPPLPPKPN